MTESEPDAGAAADASADVPTAAAAAALPAPTARGTAEGTNAGQWNSVEIHECIVSLAFKGCNALIYNVLRHFFHRWRKHMLKCGRRKVQIVPEYLPSFRARPTPVAV